MHLFAFARFQRSAQEQDLTRTDSAEQTLDSLIAAHESLPQEDSISAKPGQVPSLFTNQFETGFRPTSLATSILFHCAGIAVISFSAAYNPTVVKVSTNHYMVRQLDLQTPDSQEHTPRYRIPYPSSRARAENDRAQQPDKQPQHISALSPIAKLRPGPQTIIQADIPTDVALSQEIALPQFVIWTPGETKTEKIVAPQVERPASADATPSLDKPNQEASLADTNLRPSNKPTDKATTAAGTSTPITSHLQQQAQIQPATASQTEAQPTPAAVLSISDLHLVNGTAILPPVNEAAVHEGRGTSLSATSRNKSQSKAAIQSHGSSTNTSHSSTNHSKNTNQNGNPSAKTDSSSRPEPSAEKLDMGKTVAVHDSDTASQDDHTTHISLPKNGHFGSVIVGNSLSDQYPEIEGVWSGRIAYTAYLHVGLAKSWILQYSLPRNDAATSGGNISRLEAPWPYNIVRPNIPQSSPGAGDETVMIHGFVNQSGRFESLRVIFPQTYPHSQFVLAALSQWQFRPAMRDGQPTGIEVLIIIPEALE